MIFPCELKRGGTVLLTAPSSPLVPDQPAEAIAEAVERMGFRVKIGASCTARPSASGYTVPPEIRAKDINQGFADPSIDAIWCVRGGEAAWQVLPYLDCACIAAHPKPFIGFSDITTLHLAIQQRCGLVTFHGPTANRVLDWGGDNFSWPSLLAAMDLGKRRCIRNPPGEPIKILRPGRACGLLTGGNLSLVTQTIGTPGQINACGKILFLEDVGEEVYALERMLNQLQRSGVLESAAGLVFGPFSNCPNHRCADYGPEELLRDLFGHWPGPVLYNVRSAHCRPMVTLPLGAMCTIDGNAGTMTCRCI